MRDPWATLSDHGQPLCLCRCNMAARQQNCNAYGNVRIRWPGRLASHEVVAQEGAKFTIKTIGLVLPGFEPGTCGS